VGVAATDMESLAHTGCWPGRLFLYHWPRCCNRLYQSPWWTLQTEEEHISWTRPDASLDDNL